MISGCIITLNEERNIAECIASVRALCDDVVVLDSGSTDSTRAIAEEAGARVFTQEYLGDGPQKNRAVELARHDWVLSIDADERLTPSCAKGCGPSTSPTAGTMATASAAGPSWAIDGYRATAGTRTRWYACSTAAGPRSRTAMAMPTSRGKSIADIDADILHYSFEKIADLIYGQKFAIRDALAFHEQGRTSGPVTPVARGAWSFLRSLVLRAGFLQGIDGVTVAIAAGLNSYMKYAILNEMQRDETARERYREQYGRLTGKKQ